jgi:ABC-type bacteriocin/lantibiotic exporter with double-glycine peptidase domain
MSGLQKLTQGGLLLLLLVAICLGAYSALLSQRLDAAQQREAEQQKTLVQQAGLIATLQTQDAQNRILMASQQQQEQRVRQQNDSYQRKYRNAIKNDACAKQSMSSDVVELLRPATDSTAASDPVTP